MKFDVQDVTLEVLAIIQQILPNYIEGPLSEQLDSLHRLFVIEQLEKKFQVDLYEVLFDKEVWSNILTLSKSVFQEVQ